MKHPDQINRVPPLLCASSWASFALPEPSRFSTSSLQSSTPRPSGWIVCHHNNGLFFENCPNRTSMLGLCSAIARVGGISAPWVAVYLPAQVFTPIHFTLDFVERTLCFQGMVHPAWSLYVFGSLSAVAGLLAAFSLTETLGHPLPNTFEVFCQTHIFVISLSRIWRG